MAALKTVFDGIAGGARNDAERNAGAFYKSCMTPSDAAKVTSLGTSFRAEIEAATSPDAIAAILGRMTKRGVSAFFAFSVGADTMSRGRHAVGNAYPAGFDYWTDYTTDDGKAARLKVLTTAIAAVEPALAAYAVAKMAQTALTMETTLAALGNQGDQKAHPVGAEGLADAAPGIDWKTYFATLGAPANLGSFPVSGLEAFAAIDKLIATTPADDLHAYLTAEWYASIPRAAATEASCEQQVAFTMADAIEPRFLEAAGVDAKAQAKARKLFRAIVDAFGEELKAEPFLDVSTRVEAEVKLSKMRGAIGASKTLDTFADIELDPNEMFEVNNMRLSERGFVQALAQMGKSLPLLHVDFPSPIVNASYDGVLNKINVPGGILGGYFFSAKSPNLANFAAIGTVLGHELTHGFDNNGRTMDGDGLFRDWWTPSVDAAFKERAQCLVDEYSAFTEPGVTDPQTGQTPAHLNGQQTLPENIADNGGVKTAFRASKVESLTGPVVAGFTPPQQFFISYAQLWCEKMSPKTSAEYLVEDSHSPGKARVNVPLQNFDAFATAFQCQAGAAMAPANRCGVW
jgi:predicted metalloendopeptidase